MRRVLQLGLLVMFAASQLPAAEMANLRNGFSIRHERHEVQGETTRLYLADGESGYVDVATAEIESFEPAPAESDPMGSAPKTQADLSSIISYASAWSRIDADFIASVIRAESGNNPRAMSRKGAQGLMQLMPETAANLGVKDSFDPAENVDGGVRYLHDLLIQYNGDAARALAAYNAGPHRVQQYGGVPPYRETHAYVARVISDYNRKKVAETKHAAKQPSKSGAQSRSEQSSISAGR